MFGRGQIVEGEEVGGGEVGVGEEGGEFGAEGEVGGGDVEEGDVQGGGGEGAEVGVEEGGGEGVEVWKGVLAEVAVTGSETRVGWLHGGFGVGSRGYGGLTERGTRTGRFVADYKGEIWLGLWVQGVEGGFGVGEEGPQGVAGEGHDS